MSHWNKLFLDYQGPPSTYNANLHSLYYNENKQQELLA